MSSLNPVQVSDLLQAAGAGSAVYLIGAGGCGMSGLGHLLLDLLQVGAQLFALPRELMVLFGEG